MAITGYTTKTKENLQLDSGAYYINFDVGTDTPETATGKLIGATQNGGTFTAKATFRNVQVDGMHCDLKEMEFIDKWDVNMTVNTMEITTQNLKLALGAASTKVSNEKWDLIEGKTVVTGEDFLENVTFVGRISGTREPIIIQVLNALCVDGLVLDSKDNGNAVVSMNFKGHGDETLPDKAPFRIYRPKSNIV